MCTLFVIICEVQGADSILQITILNEKEIVAMIKRYIIAVSLLGVANQASADLWGALLRGAIETGAEAAANAAIQSNQERAEAERREAEARRIAEEKRAEEVRKAREREKRMKEEERRREEARIRRIESFAKERLAKVWSAYESIDKTEKMLSDLRATLVQFDFKPGTDPDYIAAKGICDELKNDKKAIWTSIENAYIADQRFLALPDVEESVSARDKAFSESNLLAETVLAKIKKFKEGV